MAILFGENPKNFQEISSDYQGNKPKVQVFIILRANSNKIRTLVDIAKEKGFDWSAFTDTMTIGSWDEQLEKTKGKSVEELVFYGVVLFGEWEAVSEVTRKFSLWK